MWIRILLNGILAGSILFLPWWTTVLMVAAFLFVFDAYEVLAWGIVADSLYAVPTEAFFGIEFFTTIIFTVLFVVITLLKKRLIFYTAV